MKKCIHHLPLLLFFIFASEGSQADNRVNPTDSVLIFQKVVDGLRTVFSKNDFDLTNPSVTQNEKGYLLAADADFMGIKGSQLRAELASISLLTKLAVSFPNNSFRNKQLRSFGNINLTRWIPDGIKENLRIVEFSIEFVNNNANRLLAGFGASNWLFSDIGNLSLKDIHLSISVSDPGSRNPVLQATADGSVHLGGATVLLKATAANERAEWVFSGGIKNLSAATLMNSIGFSRPSNIPESFWNFQLDALQFLVRQNRLDLKAASQIGEVQVLAVKNGKNPNTYLMGIAPGPSMQLSSLVSELKPIDDMGITNTIIVISSIDQKADLNAFNRMGTSPDVKRGLNVLASYDINKLSPELGRFLGESNLFLRGSFAGSLSTINLEAALRSNIRFDAAGNVIMKGVRVNFSPAPAAMKISLGGELELKVNRDKLLFDGNVSVNISDLSMMINGVLKGDWNNPFGISPGITLSNLGLGVGITFRTTPIPLPILQFRGQLAAGPRNYPKFRGNVVLALDPGNPQNCMIDAGFNKIMLRDIVDAFIPQVGVPAGLQNTVLRSSLQDVRLTVVPNPQGVEVLGIRYNPGFLVKGKMNIGDYYASMLLGIDNTGIEAAAGISGINFSPFFRLSGSRGRPDPMIHLILKKRPDAGVKISGSATLLGLTSETDLVINDNGLRLLMNGRIFNLFESSLDVSAGSLANNGEMMYIKAEMKNDLFRYITENASREIDKATKETQNSIAQAQRDMTNAQNQLNGLYTQVNQQRAVVQAERDRDCRKLRDAETDLNQKRSRVNSLNSDINSLNGTINRLKKEMKDNVLKIPENSAKITYYGTQVAGLETAKATAQGVMYAAEKTVGLMAGMCKATPVDLDPRVSTLIGSIEMAKGTIEAAKYVAEGGKIIGVGTLQATKWIVQNGNPMGVVNISSASFEGNLKACNGGTVSLKVIGTFAGKPINSSFSFNFYNPVATVNAWARSLLQ